MQQIKVQIVGPKASQARGTGLPDSTCCGVVGHHLGDQEHLAPLPCDDVSDQLFGTTDSINLGRVDKCQA